MAEATMPERPKRGEGCRHEWRVNATLNADMNGDPATDRLDVVTVVWCTRCDVSRTAPGASVPAEGAPKNWIGWEGAEQYAAGRADERARGVRWLRSLLTFHNVADRFERGEHLDD